MTTQQLLDVLRDVPSGPERAAIVEELGCDAEWLGVLARASLLSPRKVELRNQRLLIYGEWLTSATASRRWFRGLGRQQPAVITG